MTYRLADRSGDVSGTALEYGDAKIPLLVRDPSDAVQYVLDELFLVEVLRVVPHVRVPDSSTFVFALPCHWVIVWQRRLVLLGFGGGDDMPSAEVAVTIPEIPFDLFKSPSLRQVRDQRVPNVQVARKLKRYVEYYPGKPRKRSLLRRARSYLKARAGGTG